MRILLLLLLIPVSAVCQVRPQSNTQVWNLKEYNKDKALYDSKEFLFTKVLKTSEAPLRFEVIPLAAAWSGELTTLIYKCTDQQKEGLILGFYGSYWNDAGVEYTGMKFKNLPREEAIEFLNTIDIAIQNHEKYIRENPDNNNIVFQFDDIQVLVYRINSYTQIRLFWGQFDSSWEQSAFDKSNKRFNKRLSK